MFSKAIKTDSSLQDFNVKVNRMKNQAKKQIMNKWILNLKSRTEISIKKELLTK